MEMKNQPVYFSSQMQVFKSLKCVLQYARYFLFCKLGI